MIKFDEEALMCDLAETYNIYDFRQLPLYTVAVFANGLRSQSRIKMLLSDITYTTEELFLSGILDRLSLLVYAQTKDAQKGVNRPEMISTKFIKDNHKKINAFYSGEDFEEQRQIIMRNCEVI